VRTVKENGMSVTISAGGREVKIGKDAAAGKD
jgi:hypothetical protein